MCSFGEAGRKWPGWAGLGSRYPAALGGIATLVWDYRPVNRVDGTQVLRKLRGCAPGDGVNRGFALELRVSVDVLDLLVQECTL